MAKLEPGSWGRGYGSRRRSASQDRESAQARGAPWVEGVGGPSAKARPQRTPRPPSHLSRPAPPLPSQTQRPSRLAVSVGSAADGLPRRVLGASRPAVLPPGPPAGLPPASPSWSGGPGTASTAAPPDLSTAPQPEPRADGVMKNLPYFCRGEVVRGFGRGSKQLGIPTGERGRARAAGTGHVGAGRQSGLGARGRAVGLRTEVTPSPLPPPALFKRRVFSGAEGAGPGPWLWVLQAPPGLRGGESRNLELSFGDPLCRLYILL